MNTYQIIGPAKFGGRCVKCDRTARDFEAVLLRGGDNKFSVAHASCAGSKIKNKVSGGRVVSGPDSLTI